MVVDSALCNQVFNESINHYHVSDNIDQPMPRMYEAGDVKDLLFKKNWIDTVQWHLEDEIRDPGIDPSKALMIKQKIDKSNQDRTDIVELLDHLLAEEFKNVLIATDATVNTETPAWAIDRLSILALKIFHMNEAAHRENASQQHRDECSQKLKVLLQQQTDLSLSINQLLIDLESGKKVLKLYKQMKMYNDPALNPILYKA